jgi:O-antigen/teichoic acid export membrane protein
MKSQLAFVSRIMSIRLAMIGLSLAQTTLWATVLGLDSFGVTSAYISAQSLACLIGRFGSDNLIVRQYKDDPIFAARFLGVLLAIAGLSVLTASLLLAVLNFAVFRTFMGGESLVFLPMVVGVNLSIILSRILVAQKRAATASFLGGVLPAAVSVGLFALVAPVLDSLPLSGPVVAIGLFGLGHLVAATVMAGLLRAFWRECVVMMRATPLRISLLFGPGQWYFLGYQSIGLLRGAGMTLAVAALFSPAVTGVFALAYRFGNLLTYLNEPARLYATPRVAGKTLAQITRLYRQLLVLNAGLGISGSAFLVCVYILVPLPFPIDPPFLLFTLINMGAAAINLFVGPVGIILAMSGNERNNFVANLWGLFVVIACTVVAAITQSPVFAVIGVAGASLATNLINTIKMFKIIKSAQ